MSANSMPAITTNPSLLYLLQITDSFFPTGSFSQSYGLETYVQMGVINNKESLRRFLAGYLRNSVAASDCLAAVLAHRAAVEGDMQAVTEVDTVLNAMKLARESREAGIKTGMRMLKTAIGLFPDRFLALYGERVKEAGAYGQHAVVFGLMARALGLEARDAALAFVYTVTASMVNNGVRLIPLGQNEGQGLLVSLHKDMSHAAETSLALTLADMGSAVPALEIRAMQHEYLYSRLFMS